MLTSTTVRTQLLLCALSGAVFGLAWPPSPWSVFAPVLMVPFLFYWFPQRNQWTGIAKAYMFFLLFTLVSMRWMFGLQVGVAGKALVVLALLLIPAFQSLPYIAFLCLGRWLKAGYWILVIPVLNTALEMAQYHWDLGFTWLHLGLSVSGTQAYAAGLELLGIDGVSWLVYTSNILILLILAGWKQERKPWIAFGALMLALILLFVPFRSRTRGSHSMKVALAEPYYDPVTYKVDELYRHSRHVLEALQMASVRGAQLVVFPEGYLRNFESHPVLLNDWDRNPAMREIREQCRKLRVNLITGAIGIRTYEPGEAANVSARMQKDGRYYDMQNVVILVDTSGNVQYRAKSRLVPFMERVPFLEAFAGLERWRLSLNNAKGSYRPGESLSHFKLGNLRILPLICYESLFNKEVAAAADSADLVIEVSNEAWTSDSLMTGEHVAYGRATALANGHPYLRSAVAGGTVCYGCERDFLELEMPHCRIIMVQVRYK